KTETAGPGLAAAVVQGGGEVAGLPRQRGVADRAGVALRVLGVDSAGAAEGAGGGIVAGLAGGVGAAALALVVGAAQAEPGAVLPLDTQGVREVVRLAVGEGRHASALIAAGLEVLEVVAGVAGRLQPAGADGAAQRQGAVGGVLPAAGAGLG